METDFGITLTNKSRDRAIIYTFSEVRTIKALLMPIYEKVLQLSHQETADAIKEISLQQLNEAFGLLAPDSDVSLRPDPDNP